MLLHLFTLLYLGPWTALSAPEPKLDSIWQDAVGLYKLEKYSESCQKFEEWRTESRALHLESKDLYVNLALCQSKNNRWDRSMQSLLSLTARESMPWDKWYAMSQMERIQEQLGVQENASKDLAVRMKLLFSGQVLLFFFSMACWLLTFPGVRVVFFRKRPDALHWGLFAAGMTVLLISGGLLLNRKAVGNLAVLSAEEADISVYEKAIEVTEQRLVQLPRGTIVLTGRNANGFTQLQSPLVGWVRTEQIVSSD